MPAAKTRPMTKLLNTKEAADLLGVASSSLACDRCRPMWGIPFIRIGRSIRYDPRDLAAFVAAGWDRTAAPASTVSVTP